MWLAVSLFAIQCEHHTLNGAQKNQSHPLFVLFVRVFVFNSFRLTFICQFLSDWAIEQMSEWEKRKKNETDTERVDRNQSQFSSVIMFWYHLTNISGQFYWQVTKFAIIFTWKNVRPNLRKVSKHIINRAHKLMHNAEFWLLECG